MTTRQDSRGEYEATEGVNYSILKLYAKSPLHARHGMLHPPEPTKAMRLGAALHAAILEPRKFMDEYVVPPKVDRRTKEGKLAWAAFLEANSGKDFLDPEPHENCLRMATAAHDHPIVSQLLAAKGLNECSVYWRDFEHDAPCKCRVDRLTSWADRSVILDLKTTTDARPGPFAQQIARLNYHVQAAWYINGLATVSPHPRRWIWVAIESEPPHAVALYEPNEQMLMQGEAECRQYLKTHLDCQAKGEWPGYPIEPQSLNLPTWAVQFAEWELA